MKYNELNITKGKKTNRVGRGISAGQGKTAGRGTKGQGSRKSGGVRPGFEGGQMPLYMRIPKLRGFTSKRVAASNIYTGQLDDLKKAIVDTAALVEAGLIENAHVRVKLVANGDVTKKMTVKLHSASVSAIAMLEKAGGSFEATAQLKRPAASDKKAGRTEARAKRTAKAKAK
jgi:large subunit ribosomal protein L15